MDETIVDYSGRPSLCLATPLQTPPDAQDGGPGLSHPEAFGANLIGLSARLTLKRSAGYESTLPITQVNSSQPSIA